jgi:hypothetical protein
MGNDPGRNMYSSPRGCRQLYPGTLRPGPMSLISRRPSIKWIAKLGSILRDPLYSEEEFLLARTTTFRDPEHQGDRSILLCLDEQTGQFLWQLVVPKLAAGKVNDWETRTALFPGYRGNRVCRRRVRSPCLTTEGLRDENVGPFRMKHARRFGKPPIAGAARRGHRMALRHDRSPGRFPHNARARMFSSWEICYSSYTATAWTDA